MVQNNIMMHPCTVATLCFFKITFPEITIIATRTIFPGSVFQSMHLNLTVAIVTSYYIFRCPKVSILIENIYISNQHPQFIPLLFNKLMLMNISEAICTGFVLISKSFAIQSSFLSDPGPIIVYSCH